MQPNVRTYTALATAMGTAGEWDMALELLHSMQHDSSLRCAEIMRPISFSNWRCCAS